MEKTSNKQYMLLGLGVTVVGGLIYYISSQNNSSNEENQGCENDSIYLTELSLSPELLEKCKQLKLAIQQQKQNGQVSF